METELLTEQGVSAETFDRIYRLGFADGHEVGYDEGLAEGEQRGYAAAKAKRKGW